MLFNIVKNEKFEEYGEVLLSLLRILQTVFGNIFYALEPYGFKFAELL